MKTSREDGKTETMIDDHKDLRADGWDEGLDVEESWEMKQMKMGEWKGDGIAGGQLSSPY